MAQPTRSDWKIDVPLTNMSIAYMQMNDNFIADKVFPIVPVDKKSDKYYVYTKNDWFRDEADVRPPLTETPGSGYNLSSTSYYCDKFGFHKDIDNDDLREQESPLDFLMDATEFVTNRMLLRRELQFVTDYFATSIWGTDATPSVLWDTYATSDPITDIETGVTTVLQNTGFKPNTLVLGYQTFRYLKHHPDLIDRFKYTSAQSLTPEMIGAVVDIPRVFVAKAVKATNVEGGTAAYSFAFGKNALLCYSNPSNRPTLRQPSAGYIFSWRGLNPGGGLGHRMRQFEMEHLDGIRVEGEFAFDMKATGSDLGYFFSGAVS